MLLSNLPVVVLALKQRGKGDLIQTFVESELC